jgi:hypothetical protein
MESPPTFPQPQRIQSTMTKKGRCLEAQSAYALFAQFPQNRSLHPLKQQGHARDFFCNRPATATILRPASRRSSQRWPRCRCSRASSTARRSSPIERGPRFNALKGLVDAGLLIVEPKNEWQSDVKFRAAGWSGLHYDERLRRRRA